MKRDAHGRVLPGSTLNLEGMNGAISNAGAVPGSPYQPSEAEAARVAAVAARRRAKAASPRFSVERPPSRQLVLDADHPDRRVFHQILLDTFGATEPSFVDAVLADLVEAVHPDALGSLKADQINSLVAAVHGIAPRDELEARITRRVAWR